MKCAVDGCHDEQWVFHPYCVTHSFELLNGIDSDADRGAFFDALDQILKTLTYREREIIKLRFGLGDGYVYTQEEVGRIFKVSATTIRAIEQRAIRKLQHPVRSRPLEELVEAFAFGSAPATLVQAVQAYEVELVRFISRDPKRIYQISPRDFERLVAEIFRGFGFSVELTQQTRDGGRDVVALASDKVGIRTKYIIECKRYAANRPVRTGMVRALYGVKGETQADHALLATTSYFTDDAEQFAKSPTVLNLHLKDFNDIMKWLRDYRKAVAAGGVVLNPERRAGP